MASSVSPEPQPGAVQRRIDGDDGASDSSALEGFQVLKTVVVTIAQWAGGAWTITTRGFRTSIIGSQWGGYKVSTRRDKTTTNGRIHQRTRSEVYR